MKAMFVRDTRTESFTARILNRWKTIETRNRNMLRSLVGERVAVVQTGPGLRPMIVGYVDVVSCWYCPAAEFIRHVWETYVFPDSKYFPAPGTGKWMYELRNPEELTIPEPLPADAVRHGRSWCEF